MVQTFLILCFVVLIQNVISQDLEINNKCSFAMEKTILVCAKLNFLPANLDTFFKNETRMFVIKNCNSIHFASRNANNQISSIISYNIVDNGHIEIDECAFCGITNLHYIKITGNYLPLLKNNAFVGILHLELLNLSENNITEIQTKAFNNLESLTSLNLAKNNLKTLSTDLFASLENLQYLHLENNKIEILEGNCFSGLKRLKELDLRFNKIKILNAKDFNQLTKLDTLYLNFNQVAEIVGELKMDQLNFLALDHNKLQLLKKDTFKYLASLRSLDLSDNRLKNTTEAHFENLPFLLNLKLTNNNLNITNFSNLKKQVLINV